MEPAFLIPGAYGGQYPYYLGGREVLGQALPEFADSLGYAKAVVITNETVCPLYGDALAKRLRDAPLIVLPDGERHKTLETVGKIYQDLLACGADRDTLIIALGGGVLGDIAGYAAATFMRGLPLIQAPTTLLAMADASIGGKVGVNLPQGKNLVGAYKDPLAIFADISTLETLPDVEFQTGLAEVVKSALIGDHELLDLLERESVEPAGEVIKRAAKVKIDIVAQDPFEESIRAYLNLGHTFAHALEIASNHAISHGQAVAIGLAAAARLSVLMDLCDNALAARVETILQGLGLPAHFEELEPQAIWQAMSHDKKRQKRRLRFVLLEDIGKPKIVENVPKAAVLEVLERLAK